MLAHADYGPLAGTRHDVGTVARLLHCFAHDLSRRQAVAATGVSRHAVTDFYARCRNCVSHALDRNCPRGPGH